LEKPCNTKHQQRNLKPVLRRSVETTAQTGHLTISVGHRAGSDGIKVSNADKATLRCACTNVFFQSKSRIPSQISLACQR
ncbi:hypothetical protein, partial [uncultured Ruegeria sp.]|uniref:hypothetical protein n=1 Tax=uncultured Ruegeria sp. TaxID=259304 RepID=UPI00262A8803